LKGGALLPLIVAAFAPLLLLGLIVSGIGFGLVGWQPPVLWTNTFGASTSAGDNAIIGVSGDSSGVYSAGYSNYSDIGYPGGSIFLSKYDPAGGLVWTHPIGNSSEYIHAISAGPSGIYLVGATVGSSAGFVEKFDLAGDRLWTRNSTVAEGVFATTSGVYIAGRSTVSEYDSNGNLLWTSNVFNTTSSTTGDALSVYSDTSGVYVAGYIYGKLPGQTWIGSNDALLVKYGLSGGMIWARQFGTEFDDRAYSVSGDSTGLYVSGVTYLGMIPGFGFLQKYDFNGNLDWSVRIDSHDNSGVGDASISTDGSGVYVLIATIASREYLMKYDPTGGLGWSFQMAGLGRPIYGVGTAYRVATGSGALYVAGSLSRTSTSVGFISRVSTAPSLVLFGLNPPSSFLILGVLVVGSALSLFVFIRLRHKRIRPRRLGPSPRSLPATD
jgi:hypothetical protein